MFFSSLAPHLEIIWSETDVETVLEAQERLMSIATKEDLPELIEALRSDRNDFWTRELISEPIAHLGGVDYLPELFEALEKNSLDGHDSDTLVHFLTEIASLNPDACRAKLESLKESSESAHGKYADWLLEFCN
jgi:hypothetical protein